MACNAKRLLSDTFAHSWTNVSQQVEVRLQLIDLRLPLVQLRLQFLLV